MSAELITHLTADLMTTTLLLALPAVLTSLLIGVLISVLQTVTSVQEQTLSFAPRIVAVVIVIVASTPWMIRVLGMFSARMIAILTEVGH